MVSVAASAADTTAVRDRLDCLNRVRRDQGICLKVARERCETEFRGKLPGCFGGPACPSGCAATLDACLEPLLADRDGCRLACQADQKVAIQGCRLAADRESCRRDARVKAVKCKDRCGRIIEAPRRACRAGFDDCLRSCAESE